ncbi:peptidoglycan N-acetylglucosamine deacetylase [Clostridium sp. AM58-1XD]|nr:peptidoglycan N-acetylglucosamine deacetylase [Clostridium sp. AM58-1XD]
MGITIASAPEVSDGQDPENSKESKNRENKDNKNNNRTQDQKFIALTFDDGPHPVYTPLLLDGLAERGVKASFFLIEKNIEGNEEIVRRMATEGHLIGNHTATHIMLTSKTEEEACNEIEKTNQKILEVTGSYPAYIRPPFGSWSEELECIIPMNVVLWNIDPLDWKIQNKDKVVRHVVKNARNGGIILLHDSYQSSVDAALEIIDTLSRQGYTFVTADELLID